MTKTSNKTDEDPASSPDNPVGAPTIEPPVDIEPRLSLFFGEKKIKPALFLAAVRKKKVFRFESEDEASAWDLMRVHDSDGDRLWSLASQAALPEAVERWIWPTAQKRLSLIFGEKFAPLQQSPSEMLTVISDLGHRATSKEDVSEFNNWARIGIRWLIEQRSVDPWQVVDALGPHLFPKAADAKKMTTRAIARGRTAELTLVVATGSLAKSVVESAKRALDVEQRRSLGLSAQISRANEREQILMADVSRLEGLLATTTSELLAAKAELEAERHHSGHELTETKGAQQALLRERIKPLLSDAVDALEIDPAAPDVALRRLKNVIELIEKADE